MRRRAAVRFFLALALGCAWGPAAGAQGWENVGPPGGNVLSLAVAPPGAVYLGTSDGHVFRRAPGETRWQLRGRAGNRSDSVVQRLLVDSRDPERLWAAVWYLDPAPGGGVFASDDGGRTWNLAGLGGLPVRALEQAPGDPQTLVAGASQGVFRSRDGGRTWQRISPEGHAELRNIDSLAIDPRDAAIVYAGTYHLPWKTTDGGNTWKAIPAGMIDDSDVMSMAVDRGNPDRLYLSACSGIYRSENGGGQWTKFDGVPYSSRRTQALVEDPRDAKTIYAGTTEGLWVTRDAGATWLRTTPREAVVNAVTVDPAAGVLLGTESAGVLVSAAFGEAWTPANAGFSHHVLGGLAADPGDPSRLLALGGGLAPVWLGRNEGSGWSWAALPGGLPRSPIRALWGAGGWWAALAGGGLARYDEKERKWSAVPFLPAPGTPRARTKSRTAPARETPVVLAFHSTADGWLAGTTLGLWQAAADGKFRRVARETLAGRVEDLDLHAGLWALTRNGLLHAADGVHFLETWPAPAAAGALLWVRHIQADGATRMMVGGERGVFLLPASPAGNWELRGSGLPAVPTERPVVDGPTLSIAAAGRVYHTSDAGKTWSRLDGPAQEGKFSGLQPDGRGGFFAASLKEGLLHWSKAGNAEE